MIRRSPAELYLKYLLVHPKKYTNAQVHEIVQYVGLDSLGDWYLDRLRQRLKPPAPFFLFDKKHTPSQTWLMVEGLSFIAHPDKQGQRAFDILENARVKEYIESSLAAGAPCPSVSSATTRFMRFTVTTQAIERYREFFWNLDLLDSTEFRALLKYRIDRLKDHPNAEIKAQYEAMKSAYYKDARKTAAEMPFSPFGALLTHMRMGVLPSHVDLGKLLEYSRGLSVFRAFESMYNNGPGDSKRALDYISVLEKIVAVGKEMADPQADMLDQLASITMKVDAASLPNIHNLSLGHHTTEVVRMETTNELPAEFDDGDGSDETPGDAG